MTTYKIPVTPDPQKFSITLGGLDYQVLLTYKNTLEGGWVIDFSDGAGVPLVSGVPLVTGVDILSPHKHLGFKGAMSIQPLADNQPPTFDNLGLETFLIWTTT